MPLARTRRSEGVAYHKGSFGGASEVLGGESLVPVACELWVARPLACLLCALLLYAPWVIFPGIVKLAGSHTKQHVCAFC